MLDAAIPTGPDPKRGWITHARPGCDRGVSCLPPPPCQCDLRLPHLAHYFVSRRAASPPLVWLRSSVPCARWPGAPAAATCKEGKGRDAGEGGAVGAGFDSGGTSEKIIDRKESGADPSTRPATTGSAAPGLTAERSSYGFHVPLCGL